MFAFGCIERSGASKGLIKYIQVNRNEAYMADGYYRATGKLWWFLLL